MNNDELDDFDLSAWDAPPPPLGLADAVIDRMGAGRNVAAPVEEHVAPRSSWIIGGVAVAVLAFALGVWSLIRSTDRVAPIAGRIVADRARALSLDTVRADLDVGADVRWRRQRGVLSVEQRAGRIAWRVDAGEKLVIDAGAAASVEATGANLRVEVQMNAMDTKVIGASALTAAAVAVITVVVYEGHVHVTRPGQPAVVVAPGSTYHFEPSQEAPVVGVTVDARKKVAILGLEHVVSGSSGDESRAVAQVLSTALRNVAGREGPFQLIRGVEKELVDEKVMMNCANEAPTCMAAIGVHLGADMLVFGSLEADRYSYRVSLELLDVRARIIESTRVWALPLAEAEAAGLDTWARQIYLSLVGAQHPVGVKRTPESLDNAAFANEMTRIKPDLLACGVSENTGGDVSLRVQLYPDGSVGFAEAFDVPSEGLRWCIEDVVRRTMFPQTLKGGSFTYSIPLPEGSQPSGCDAEALKDRAKEKMLRGKHAAALVELEASLECKDSVFVRELAAMEACSSNNAPKAKLHFKRLPAVRQANVAQLCARRNVAYTDDTPDPASGTPESLDRAAISKAMARHKPDVLACGAKESQGGNVKVRVIVSPGGSVTSVSVEGATDALGDCIAGVLDKATFPKTQKGGAFSYPFMLPEK